MINQYFVIIGVILTFIGSLSYILDTITGKVQPNKVTWLFWSFAPFVAFVAEIKQGVGLTSLLTFTVGIIPLLIFFISFINKKSHWKLGLFDLICASLSFCGILLWYLSKAPNIAILFSILADASAGLPTIVKAFYAPETESYLIYFLGMISAVITLLTIKSWTLAQYGFPLYIGILDLSLVVLIRYKFGNYLLVHFIEKNRNSSGRKK